MHPHGTLIPELQKQKPELREAGKCGAGGTDAPGSIILREVTLEYEEKRNCYGTGLAPDGL